MLPLDLDSDAVIVASAVKELAKHDLGIVPVKWEAAWAVVLLDMKERRYALLGCWLMTVCCLRLVFTQCSLLVLARPASQAATGWQDLLEEFRFVACLLCCRE